MTGSGKQTTTTDQAKDGAQRRADALRANLRRRKDQARGRKAAEDAVGGADRTNASPPKGER